MIRPETNNRYRDSKRLIGYAVSLDPVDLYTSARTPLPSRLSSTITQSVLNRIVREERPIPVDSDVATVLFAGIRDTHSILDPHLRNQDSYDDALAFIDHPKTAQAIAVLALRSEESLTNLIRLTESSQHTSSLPLRTDYLETPRHAATTPDRGCPAAAHEHGGAINPLFERFVRWSGRLALESLAHHNIVSALRQTK